MARTAGMRIFWANSGWTVNMRREVSTRVVHRVAASLGSVAAAPPSCSRTRGDGSIPEPTVPRWDATVTPTASRSTCGVPNSMRSR